MITSWRSLISKTSIELEKERKTRRDIDHKGKKSHVFKCKHYDRIVYLEPFCLDKMKISKGNNLRSFVSNAPSPERIWAQKVKP